MKAALIIFFLLSKCVDAKSVKVFDFFGNGLKDNSAIRYVRLRSGSKEEFSSEITICSSIYMRSFIMEQSLFQVLDEENKPWFSLYFLQLDENSMTHPLSLAVNGVYSHLHQVQAQPLRWNHACIGKKQDNHFL